MSSNYSKAKPGKIKNKSGAKKRLKLTGSGRYAHQKPAHNHLLQQKSKRQKRLADKMIIVNGAYAKMVKKMLPN